MVYTQILCVPYTALRREHAWNTRHHKQRCCWLGMSTRSRWCSWAAGFRVGTLWCLKITCISNGWWYIIVSECLAAWFGANTAFMCSTIFAWLILLGAWWLLMFVTQATHFIATLRIVRRGCFHCFSKAAAFEMTLRTAVVAKRHTWGLRVLAHPMLF